MNTAIFISFLTLKPMPKIKIIKKFVIGALISSTLPLALLVRHLLDLGDQYSASTYFQSSFKNSLPHAPSKYLPVVGVEVDARVIVMAKLESEDTNWVARELPSLVITSSLSLQAVFTHANTDNPFYLAGSAQSTPSTRPPLLPPTSHSPPL